MALLGEPGSGKTTALGEDAGRLQAHAAETGTDEAILYFDLRDYSELADVQASVFETPEVVRWKAGTHRLTLCFDSLDEALIEMRKLAVRLASELRKLPVERLRVRIACRTGDWPPVLEHELAALWGEGGLRVLEIAPLRIRDVSEIAAPRIGEERVEEFLLAVAAQDVQPFASRPGTLDFLISTFLVSGNLPASKAELFASGCRILCEETNESRRAAKRTGSLSVHQRMVVAERVAAATIFGGRAAVWTGVDSAAPASDLRRADLVGDEPAPNGTIRVDEATLRDEVLSTGLFSARGAERLGWAHQTYGEFLAARWLVRRGFSTEQMLALVTVNDRMGRQLVPQLYETAAWIGTLHREFFIEVLRLAPRALLESDVAQAEAQSRELLVSALLDAAQRNVLPAREFGDFPRYDRLRHPGLGEQLRPIIADGTRPDRVRDLALEIAIACRAPEVAVVAADLALDASASIDLRAEAARAVKATQDSASTARLLPLAIGSLDEDVEDSLKGSALRAVWRLLPPRELYDAITHAKRPNVSGAYSVFLDEFAESITDEYIVPGLEWIEKNEHTASPVERRLEAAITLRAFGLLDNPEVRERLVRLVRRSLRRYQPLLDDEEDRTALSAVLSNSALRRRVLTELVKATVAAAGAPPPEGEERDGTPFRVADMAVKRELYPDVLRQHGYIADEDYSFILDTLATTGNTAEHHLSRVAWGHLAHGVLDFNRAEHANAVLERTASPGVHETFAYLIDPIDVDGPVAESGRQLIRDQEAERRKSAARRAKWERKKANEPREEVTLPSAARLAEAVRFVGEPNRAEDLPRLRWFHAFNELVRDEKGNIPSSGNSGDPRSAIAWRDADAPVREEVIDSATQFVESATAPKLDVDDDVHFHRYAWGGYVALRLLAAEAPARLEALSDEAWRRWAPTVVLAEPYSDAPEEQGAHAALVRRAYAAVPEAVCDALLADVDHALAVGRWRVPARAVTALAATELGNSVLYRCTEALAQDNQQAVDNASVPSSPFGQRVIGPSDGNQEELERERRAQARQARAGTLVSLLSALLQGGSLEARSALEGVLGDPAALAKLDPASLAAERSLIAAQSLLVGADDAAWGLISRVVNAAPNFARELFLRTAIHRESPIKDFRTKLGPRGVGELFVGLARAFPYEKDPHHNGVFSPSARDNVRHWRRAALTALEEYGTEQALDELQRVQDALPQYDWLGYSVAKARDQLGRAAWVPVPPSDLFALADDLGRRLVRNEDELLDLVVDSLGRYQRELQGDLPAVVDLWDYSAKTKPRPRDEGNFADHVTRFLKKDLEGRGIAVGCELVVRRGGGGRLAPGLRTDIYVTAVIASPGSQDRTAGEVACVVIEAKGSWHDEVRTAMRTQLVEGYLREHAGTRRGIYLVGDVTGDSALHRELQAQADELSLDGLRVRAVVLDASLPSK